MAMLICLIWYGHVTHNVYTQNNSPTIYQGGCVFHKNVCKKENVYNIYSRLGIVVLYPTFSSNVQIQESFLLVLHNISMCVDKYFEYKTPVSNSCKSRYRSLTLTIFINVMLTCYITLVKKNSCNGQYRSINFVISVSAHIHDY